ncbi:MAG: phosphotransferase [Bacteroidaceae bacterium]|nr:phosphotransferase [Bacteroidaceae bacterium]
MEKERLIDLFVKYSGEVPASIDKLPGAGSNRQYYRLTGADGVSVIGVVGTSEEENRAFVELSKCFESRDFSTPKLYAHSDDYMVYLQEDLGSTSLFDFLKEGREKGGDYNGREVNMLALVMSELPKIQFEGGGEYVFSKCYPQPEMDKMNIMFDLNYFKYNFVKLTGVEFNEIRLQEDFDKMAAELLQEDGNTFLYRDFQARNVMLKDGQPYFIDYQGGRKGPIYYDVASFLWQASAKYSDELRRKLIKEYYHSLQYYIDSRECPDCYKGMTFAVFEKRLHQFVLFRLLQVLGAYGFRGLWEKKKHFIDSIPPALANLKEELALGTCDDYPYLKQVCESLIEWAPKPFVHDELIVRVFSFSYKKGIPEDVSGNGGGYVFDCRSSNNPGRYAEYKKITGLDKPVIDFLEKDGEILDFLDHIYPLVDFHTQRWLDRGFKDLQISCGCTGGQHRSVYSAQHIAEHLSEKFGVEVHLCHREQGITQIFNKK